MKNAKKIITSIFIILFFGMIIFSIVLSNFFASSISEKQIVDATDEYVITNYTVDAKYKKDNTVVITENITANFLCNYKHGIYRGLPEVSQLVLSVDESGTQQLSKKLRLKYKLTSSNTDYYINSSDNYTYFAFGDENKYIPSGTSKTYQFSYVVTMDSRYIDYGMFYYNVLGNLWDTTIANFSAKVSFEDAVDTTKTTVFYGEYGSASTLTPIWSADNKSFTLSATNLGIGKGVTVKSTLPENYATAARITTVDYVMFALIILTTLAFFGVYKRNSNKTTITPVVQFSAVNNHTSADVGYIIDKKVNTVDIASLIIYWAEKGFVNIIEEDKKTYIEATEKSIAKMKAYEKKLFKAIFGNRTLEASRVDIDDIGEEIKDVIPDVKKMIAEENSANFNKKAVNNRGLMIVLTSLVLTLSLVFVNYQNVNDLFALLSIIAGLATCVFLFSFAAYIDKKDTATNKNKFINRLVFVLYGLAMLLICVFSFDAYCDPFFTVFLAFIMVVFAIFFVFKFNVRTDEGCKALGDIIGLKSFIEVTEVDRLKMLAKDNPKMFYNIMPFAYVFGLYDTWCKKFEKIDIGTPDFYYSSGDAVFDFIIFNHMINATNMSILRSINTASMAKMAEHIGNTAGSVGGGFSGGGAGGGGGGSW